MTEQKACALCGAGGHLAARQQQAPRARHAAHCLMLDPEEPACRCSCGALPSDRSGYDRLWLWFGLSRSAYAIMPRVMMHAMPDAWQDRMAALLEEWMEFWPNMPDVDAHVQIRQGGRVIQTPPWLINYRHPDRQQLAEVHGGNLEGGDHA
ncbi:hypothetical protein [Pseudomonas citronellolis]|uniref:hypothetical protein n=1 Tax=Pseudomonas citronellolis TaxID=53408 RepID=UPI0023E37D70|nr:hypothetical protein [Pseudomonas citronellolis]MDF3933513.1 hypothetical protein [Pseudomonas citronellolis]